MFEKFGNYLLLHRLARGGMAEVYLARPASAHANGRIVVIKRILPGGGDDPDFLEMFRKETHICMGLNHPYIIQLHDSGKVDGQPFIAMEYVQGKNLREVLRRFAKAEKSVPLPVAMSVIAQAASGLHYAHTFRNSVTGEAMHIIHRDVSPQNILLSYNGNVKIIDFGIAKMAAAQSVTVAGPIKGKASYLSPEQARGETLDPRSDVFALGTVLWELLTGRKLFDSKGGTDLEVLEEVLEYGRGRRPLMLPSHENPEIPRQLYQIVALALRAKRDDRYSSAEEMQRDLQDLLATREPGFGYHDISELLRPIFAERIIEEQGSLRRLNQAAQKELEQSDESGVTSPAILRPREPERDLNAQSPATSTVMKAAAGPAFSAAPPPPPPDATGDGLSMLNPPSIPLPECMSLSWIPPGAQLPVHDPISMARDSGMSSEIRLQTPPPIVRSGRELPVPLTLAAPSPAIPSIVGVPLMASPATLGPRRRTVERSAQRFGKRVLLSTAFIGMCAGAYFLVQLLVESGGPRVERKLAYAPPPAPKSALLKVDVEPFLPTVATRILINGHEVRAGDRTARVPLDTRVKVRVERPAFQPYQNEFVLSSSQMRPSGVFRLRVDLRKR